MLSTSKLLIESTKTPLFVLSASQPSKPDFLILTEMMKYRMHEMQITQKELSGILKISTPRLNQIMSGKKAPAYRQAQIIATELKIDAEIVLSV